MWAAKEKIKEMVYEIYPSKHPYLITIIISKYMIHIKNNGGDKC
jgi:hypothetical protein